MEVLSIVLVFIVSVIILVAFHEYGHFIVARINNVKVLEFAVGFGKILFSYKAKNSTKYLVKLLPLGGYVKMLDSRESNVTSQEKKFDFNSKHPLQKISVVLAGPIFNFILAFFCFFCMYLVGVLEREPTVYSIDFDSAASKAGMSVEDNYNANKKKITKINDDEVYSFEDVQILLAELVGNNDKDSLNINLLENNIDKSYTINLSQVDYMRGVDLHKSLLAKKLGINLIPTRITINSVINKDIQESKLLQAGDVIFDINNNKFNMIEMLNFFKENPNTKVKLNILRDDEIKEIDINIGNKNNKGYLGIIFDMPFNYVTKKYGIIQSITQSFHDTYKYIEKSFTMIFKIFLGEIGLENVHGPIMVAKVADKSWGLGVSQFLKFLGIISIGLGVINLLPIPLLDGGHVIYHLVEWVNPKLITKGTEEAWFKVGISFILVLFFLALYNDIKYW